MHLFRSFTFSHSQVFRFLRKHPFNKFFIVYIWYISSSYGILKESYAISWCKTPDMYKNTLKNSLCYIEFSLFHPLLSSDFVGSIRILMCNKPASLIHKEQGILLKDNNSTFKGQKYPNRKRESHPSLATKQTEMNFHIPTLSMRLPHTYSKSSKMNHT